MGMNFPEEKTLVINEKNPIIQKVVSLSEDENNKEKVETICRQVVDLALIGNKALNANELDEFIKRSNDLMLELL